jgi:hypothetical protein
VIKLKNLLDNKYVDNPQTGHGNTIPVKVINYDGEIKDD